MAGTPETPIPAPVANFSNTTSIDFDGISSAGVCELSGITLPGPTGYTYSLWIQSTNFANTNGMYILTMNSTPTLHLDVCALSLGGTTKKLNVAEGAGGVSITDPTPLTDSGETTRWYHVCVTSTSTTSAAGTLTLYVNGVSVVSGAGDTLQTATHINVSPIIIPIIGRAFYGMVDELAIWDAPLSAAQVATLYTNASGLGGKASDVNNISGNNLKIWWRMGDLPDDTEGDPGYIYNAAPVPGNRLEIDDDVTITTPSEKWGPASDNRFQITTPENSGTGLEPRVLNQKSVTFDGVDQSYSSSIGAGPDFTVGGDGMTISCNVKLNSTPSGVRAIFGQANIDSTGTHTAFMIYMDGAQLQTIAADSASGDWIWRAIDGLSTGIWYTVTVTLVPGGYMTGYIWGSQSGTPAAISAGFGATWSANRCWSIGAWRYGGTPNPSLTDFADIQVDECVVFNKALSQAEIMSNITKQYDRPDWSTPTTDLSIEFAGSINAWWRMGDTAGDSATRMFDATGTWGNEDSAAFDGIDDGYLSDVAVYRPGSTARSISWWMKPNSPGALYDDIIDFFTIKAYHRLGILQFGGYGVSTLIGPPAGSVWAHFVFSHSSTNMYIYKNGSEVASSSNGYPPYSGTVKIGIGSSRTGTNPWPGNLDEVCFWEGTALSEANALEMYNTGSALDMNTFTGTAPTNWWRMGDGAGDSGGASGVLIDQMGSLDFSAIGAPVIEEDVPGQGTGNTLTGSGLSASDIQDEIPIIYFDTQAGGPYFAPPTIITPIQVPYVNPVPLLASSSPPSGTIDGGTTITITGINLNGVISVVVGGVFCTSPTSVSATSITAVTSATTAGVKDIVVTTTGGYGTLSNAFTYAFDIMSIAFDGIDDGYLSDVAVYRPGSTARSISWWMKPNSPGALYDYFIDFHLIAAYHRLGVLQFGGYGVSTLIGPPAGSVWAHFVFSHSSTNMYIYKNGSEVASSSNGYPPYWSTSKSGIGSDRYGGSPWPGNLDEVCFWEGTALSEANALEIYNTGSALDMATFSGTAPTNWYRMGDDPGDSGGASGVLIDQMGNMDFSAIGAPVIQDDVPPT